MQIKEILNLIKKQWYADVVLDYAFLLMHSVPLQRVHPSKESLKVHDEHWIPFETLLFSGQRIILSSASGYGHECTPLSSISYCEDKNSRDYKL